MPTVIDDDTGEEVEVRPVHAVAAVANVNQFGMGAELPQNAAKRIEQAMVVAIQQCMAEGISDPLEIRERMMDARDTIKKIMVREMNDLRSQAAAKEV